MRNYKIRGNLFCITKQLYAKTTSAVQMNSIARQSFTARVGIRQGCLLSSTLINIFSNALCLMVWKNMLERRQKRRSTKDTPGTGRIRTQSFSQTKLSPIWRDNTISPGSQMKLMRSLVKSIFLKACKSWT